MANITGFPTSNEVKKDIDCATVIPPSPEPVLNPASTYCVSGDSLISFSWTPSDNVVSYSVYRVGATTTKFDLPPSQISFLDSGIESGYTYTYSVTAFGREGKFINSPNTQTVTAVDCMPPSPASTLTVTPDCESGEPVANLSWNPQTSNTEAYEIWRATTTPTSFSLLMTFNKIDEEFDSRTWKDTNVSGATTYYYRVVSKGPTGVSSTNSNTPFVTTSSCLPIAPVLIITPACQSGSSVMNLSWTDGGANTSYYEIFRQDYLGGNSPYQTILNPRATTTPDSGVIPGTNYTYKIDAIGFLGNRIGQGWQPQKTALNCSVPGPFTLNETAPYCQGAYPRADLSWSASTNATSYDLIRSLSNPTTFYGLTDTSYSDLGFGNALSFNGNYVYTSNYFSNPNIFTLELWFRTNTASGGKLIGFGNAQTGWSSNYDRHIYMNNSGQIYFGVYPGAVQTINSSKSYNDNNLHHVMASLSGLGMKLYIDGDLVASNPSVTSAQNYTGYWKIGFDNLGSWTSAPSSYYFTGVIDEVRVYNRALLSPEVTEHYNGIYNNDTGLVSLWHFDEGTGTSASDSTNNGNYGTLAGSLSWVQNGLQWQKNYSWQTRAIGPGGSTLSNTTPATTTPLCAPTKPGINIQSSFCNSGVVNTILRWSYTTNANKYEIYRDGVLIKIFTSTSSEFSSRTWTDTVGLAQQTSYSYYIKSIGSAGTSQSDPSLITTPNCLVPPPPQTLTANFTCCTAATGGSCGSGNSYYYPRVNLSWSSTTNTTSYTIYRAPTGAGFPVTNWVATSYSDTSAIVYTNYTYSVRAYGPGGGSVTTSDVNILVGYCVPFRPSITSLATVCESNAPANTISWNAIPTFNTFSYEIYRNTSATIPATPIITFASTTPEFASSTWKNNSGLSNSTAYYYWVKAVGPAGNTTSLVSSPIITLNCGIIPSAPTLNLNSVFCQNNLPYAVLSWNNVANANSYNLYRANPDSPATSTYSTRLPSPTSFTDRGSYALNFDGADDYVDAGNGASLDITGNLTIEAWIYPRSFGGNSLGRIVDKMNSTFTGFAFYIVNYSGEKNLRFYVNNSAYADANYNSISLNTWQHVVVSYNGANATFYVNGSQKGSPALTANPVSGTQKLIIGNRSLDLTRGFNGTIDDLRIYNRALNEAEALNHFNGVYSNESGLVGVWHFDEGSGITAYDQSGNTNNGTLNNGPAWQTDSTTSLKVLPLESLKTYKYKVKAFGADTESAFSNEVSTTTPSCQPAKPDLTVTAQCPEEKSQLFLDWSQDANTSYWSIYKKRAEEPYSFLIDIASSTDFADDNVESGIDYEYFEIAVGSGTSTISNAASGTAPFCAPQPQKPIITATSTCQGYSARSKIEWQTGDNTISYNVWRKNTSLGEINFATTSGSFNLPASAVLYLDSVNENQNYIYKVEAVGSGTGNSVSSDPSQEITSYECSKIAPLPMILSLNLVYSVDHNVAVSIGWTDAGNEENYKVFRRISGELEFAKQKPSLWQKILSYILGETSLAEYENPLITLDADILNYVDYTVTDGVTYDYQVMASNVNGSTFSNIIQVPVPIARPGEFELSGIRLPDYRIYLTWTEALSSLAGGQVTYDILRSTASDFSSPTTTCSVVIDPRECFDNSPPLFASVYYKAIATNIGGITESNIVRVNLPVPIWKEIMPW